MDWKNRKIFKNLHHQKPDKQAMRKNERRKKTVTF